MVLFNRAHAVRCSGKPVEVNNLVPAAAVRAKDSADFILNADRKGFYYGGYTRPLSAAFPVQVRGSVLQALIRSCTRTSVGAWGLLTQQRVVCGALCRPRSS